MKRFKNVVLAMLIMFMMVGSTASAQVFIATAPRTKIDFVGLDRSLVIQGTKQTFYLTSEGAEDVQYKIWIRYPGTNDWEDITKGYTNPVKAKDLYAVTPEKVLNEGAFYGSIWVKKAGEKGKQSNSNGDFDSYYTFTFDVKETGMDLAKDVKTDKEEYILGDTIKVDGIDGLENVEYRIHAYDVEKNRWISNTDSYEKSLTWKPQHSGRYMLDLWVRKIGSTEKWEAFKLKPITVKVGANEKIELPEYVEDVSGSIEGLDKVLEGKVDKDNYIIKDGHMLISTNKELDAKIKPSHKIESAVNPNLEEQVYKMLRITTADGYCPSFVMSNKGDYMFAQNDLCLHVHNKKNGKDDEFAHYRFFRTDLYAGSKNPGDYKRVVDIEFDNNSNNINDKDNMKMFRMCNKVVLGEKSDEITDYMIELLNKTPTKEDRMVNPSKTFGDIRVSGLPGGGKYVVVTIELSR